jgi:hypothetical protein
LKQCGTSRVHPRPPRRRQRSRSRIDPRGGLGQSCIGRLVTTISISAEALAAIEATLPEGREADRRPDGKGGYFITLSHGVVDRLNYLRRNGLELQRRPPGAGGGVRGRTLRDAR